MARRRPITNEGEISFHRKRKRFNKHKFFRDFLNWFVLIMIAAVLGYAIVTFLAQTVLVVGPSMNDVLFDGQQTLVNKLVYDLNPIERYDIIAYEKNNSDSYYDIKRVVGLPGETVRISEGLVYINGKTLSDLPSNEVILTPGMAQDEIVLGDEEYFVLGDNVNNSEDSRYSNIGKIKKNEILGRVDYILSPRKSRGKVK